MNRPLTAAEERLLAHLAEKPDITEHIVAEFDAACGNRKHGGHVVVDFRFFDERLQDAEVSVPRRVGVR